MTGPVNGLIGDSFGTDLPETIIDANQLNEERRLARFSKTAEFKKIKAHIEERIKHHQQFLPGNTPPIAVAKEERGHYWAVADEVIKELRGIIDTYERAAEVIKEANKNAG